MFKKFAALLSAVVLTMLPLGGIAWGDTATNLVTNPSMETSTSGTTPDGWTSNSYCAAATYATATQEATGHAGKSVKVQIAAGMPTAPNAADPTVECQTTVGDADWAFTPVTVTPGTDYQYSHWYMSDVDTEIDMQTTYASAAVLPAGCDTATLTCYDNMVTVPASPSQWTQVKVSFAAAAGATAVSLFQPLTKTGYVQIDDADLHVYTPSPFTMPMVSVTFDDGWLNQLTNATPVMQSNGLIGTYYIISGASDTEYYTGSPYMSADNVKSLYAAGNEIGSHTVHHCDLGATAAGPDAVVNDAVNCPIPLGDTKVLSEMQNSKTTLEGLTGAPVTDFAYPYGSYSAHTIAVGQSLGYLSQRSVNPGYNTKDSLEVTQLKMYEVDHDITTAQVQAWIDEAIAQHAWLILCYHEVADTPSDPNDLQYTTPIADFQAQMAYLAGKKAQNQVAVKTVAQALQTAQAEISGGTIAADPLTITAPLVTTTGQTTATVTWTTNQPASSQVQYGATTSYGSSASDAALTTNHVVKLIGLTAGTTYHVMIGSTANLVTVQSADLSFTTLAMSTVGDLSGPGGLPDGIIDDYDALVLFANWGVTPGHIGDISGLGGTPDGTVDDYDALVLFANWSTK